VIELLDRRTLTSFVLDRFVAVEDLLKTVLVDFGVISRDDLARGILTKAAGTNLSVTLREFLQSLAALQAFAVVIIDEAQNLPIDVLEQICALADVAHDQPLLQVVLVGQPDLLRLRRPKLRPFDRRMVRCKLEPLAEDEIAEYITHRLAVAGSSGRVKFSDRAVERLYKLSEGVPRVINLLCDRALIVGHLASASVIDQEAIDEAAGKLGLARTRLKVVGWAARAAMVGLALTVLGLVGATAAAWVFRAPLSRAIVRWEQVPQPPPVPALRSPAPLVPLDPPAGADGAP
jgi:general secretion pathway protein A